MTEFLLFLFGACIVLILLFFMLANITGYLVDIRSELRTLNERNNHENRPINEEARKKEVTIS